MKQNLTPRINRLEPNILIDGNMEIWPEGTSRSVVNNSNNYGGVLFNLNNISSGITLTNSQQASIPSGTSLSFSNQVSKTAAGTLAAGTNTRLRYVIEGYDIQKLMTTEFSVIFWVKSSVASNRSLSIRNGTNTHSYVQQYNIASANTWQLVAKRFPALSSCPGTLDRTNGAGLTIAWNIVSGSTFQTSTLDSWVSGNFTSGIGEDTTWLTGTNHDFSIAGVMVLPGDWSALTASGYRFSRIGKSYKEELETSQRYVLVRDQTTGTYPNALIVGAGATGGNRGFLWTPTTMRALPSVSWTGSWVAETNTTAAIAINSAAAVSLHPEGLALSVTAASALTNGDTYFGHFGGGIMILDARF